MPVQKARMGRGWNNKRNQAGKTPEQPEEVSSMDQHTEGSRPMAAGSTKLAELATPLKWVGRAKCDAVSGVSMVPHRRPTVVAGALPCSSMVSMSALDRGKASTGISMLIRSRMAGSKSCTSRGRIPNAVFTSLPLRHWPILPGEGLTTVDCFSMSARMVRNWSSLGRLLPHCMSKAICSWSCSAVRLRGAAPYLAPAYFQ